MDRQTYYRFITSVAEAFGELLGKLERLHYTLDPIVEVVPGTAEQYGIAIEATPQAGTLESDLIRWGERSIGHEEIVRQDLKQKILETTLQVNRLFKTFREAVDGQYVTQQEPQWPVSVVLDRYASIYYEAAISFLGGGSHSLERASKYADWIDRTWARLGYYLDQLRAIPLFEPVWMQWDTSEGPEDLADYLEDFFLIQVPAQKRLQPRDWLYY